MYNPDQIEDVDQPTALFLQDQWERLNFFVGRRPVEVEVALHNVRAVFLGGIEEHFEAVGQHGVVRFQDADELTRRCVKAAIHRRAVAAVLLVDYLNARVFLGVFVEHCI